MWREYEACKKCKKNMKYIYIWEEKEKCEECTKMWQLYKIVWGGMKNMRNIRKM